VSNFNSIVEYFSLIRFPLKKLNLPPRNMSDFYMLCVANFIFFESGKRIGCRCDFLRFVLGNQRGVTNRQLKNRGVKVKTLTPLFY